MKKIIVCVFVTILMIIGKFNVFADNSSDLLKFLEIIPNTITEDNSEKSVTKSEFVYMTVKLLDNSSKEAIDTQFSDVTAENKYSGYIQYAADIGLIQGVGDGTFRPDSPLTPDMASSILLKGLGYSGLFAYENENPGIINSVLDSIDFYRTLETDEAGNVTKKSACSLVENALMSKTPSLSYMTMNGKTTIQIKDSEKDPILTEKLKLNAYSGVVSDVDIESSAITFTVSKNKYQSNNVILNNGDVVTYKTNGNFNSYDYHKMPSTIYVDESETVVAIIPQKNTTVKYGTVYAVNGDERQSASYSINYINRLAFTDSEDEYDVAENAELKFNGKNTTLPTKLNGKYVRAVVCDDEIIHIETWDLSDGGLITAVESNSISYVLGTNSKKFKDINNYKETLCIVNGRCTTTSNIKTNSLLHYYVEGNYCVLIVSEKMVVDYFNSVAPNSININNYAYKADDVYFSSDGENFSKNSGYDVLLHNTVKAYIDIYDKVKYVMCYDENEQAIREFYGVISGYEKDILSDNATIRMFVIGDTEIKEEFFEIRKGTKFNDEITVSDLQANIKNVEGNGFYRFKIGPNGNILEVSKPKDHSGLEGISRIDPGNYFVNDNNPYVTLGNDRIYFKDTEIIAIYEDDEGIFRVKFISWKDLIGKYVKSATLTFYSENAYTEYPETAVLCGDLLSIGKELYTQYGVVIGKDVALNSKGETCYKLKVTSAVGSEPKEYLISAENGNNIELYSMISYYSSLAFSDYDIYVVRNFTNLTGDCSTWGDAEHNSVLTKATLKKYNNRSVYFEDGSMLFMNHEALFVVGYDRNAAKNMFYTKDIEPSEGAEVYYYKVNGTVKFMIVID